MLNTTNGAAAPHRGTVFVLIGVSGSGKTSIGKRLAPAIHATFIEGDDFHSSANIAKMRSGTPLTDADRRPWLEKLGKVAAEHSHSGRNVVLACSALRRSYRDLLQKSAHDRFTFIHLTIPPAVLEARMRARVQHFMPVTLLQSQLDTLEPLGRDENGTEIAETGTVNQTVEAIRRWIHQGGQPSHVASPVLRKGLPAADAGQKKGRQRRPKIV